MFSMLIKKDDHRKITNMTRKYLPYGADYNNRAEVISGMSRAYNQLYKETGDTLYKVLGEFIRQVRAY